MRYSFIVITVISVITLTACSQWGVPVREKWEPKNIPIASGTLKPDVCGAGEIMADTVCIPYSGSGNNTTLFGLDFTNSVTEINVATWALRGYYVEPKIPGNYPGIIMIHEWWGLNDNIKYMARLLANSGYRVLAIDLYGEVATTSERARELSGKVRTNSGEAIQKMQLATNYLKNEKSATKLGTLGWCFGGQQSLNISLETPVDATVIYYGNLTEDIGKISKLQWAVLGIFGDKDTSIPLDKIQLFQKNLGNLGKKNTFFIYPGLGHAFANPSGANYASDQTIDAWNKTLEFLEKNLK